MLARHTLSLSPPPSPSLSLSLFLARAHIDGSVQRLADLLHALLSGTQHAAGFLKRYLFFLALLSDARETRNPYCSLWKSCNFSRSTLRAQQPACCLSHVLDEPDRVFRSLQSSSILDTLSQPMALHRDIMTYLYWSAMIRRDKPLKDEIF